MIPYNPQEIKYSLDLKNAVYEMDKLQDELIQFYLRADLRFRQAFYINLTNSFLQTLKDKALLKEPLHIAIMGITRTGKTSAGQTIGILKQAWLNKMFTNEYICANDIEYLEKVKSMGDALTENTYFLIDEQKNYFGVGSTAKKTKLQDVQNIIAKFNISTASLCPTKFANEEAHYGLRTMGRCFKTKSIRLMLYNLQEGGKLPMGCVYLPHPSLLLPSDVWVDFDKEYQAKKDNWIKNERLGKGDVLMELKRKTAEIFISDAQYMALKKKEQKITYIAFTLGSEWASGEIREVYNITEMLKNGIVLKR